MSEAALNSLKRVDEPQARISDPANVKMVGERIASYVPADQLLVPAQTIARFASRTPIYGSEIPMMTLDFGVALLVVLDPPTSCPFLLMRPMKIYEPHSLTMHERDILSRR